MTPIYFVGFYTEGPPHDGGYDLTDTVRRVERELCGAFDCVRIFSRREVKKMVGGGLVCNEYPDPLPMNPNGHKIGYFDFKPFLLQIMLDEVPYGSIVVYQDMNFDKYGYWNTDWANIPEIATELLDRNCSDVFAPFYFDPNCPDDVVKVRKHVRPHALYSVLNPIYDFKVAQEARLIQASQIIVRNTRIGRKFADDYYDLCQRKDLISPVMIPFDERHGLPKWTCGDQDALNCVLYKYVLEGKLPPTFPRFAFKDGRCATKDYIEIEQHLTPSGVTE